MEELWKDVTGFEEYFRVSNLGNLFSKRTSRLYKTPTTNRYFIVITRFNGRGSKSVSFRVHRLVAEHFIDNPDNKPFVNHKDGIKSNNAYTNLEWCTSSENRKHALSTGLATMVLGEVKLSRVDVQDIKEKYSLGNYTHQKLAEEYNVSRPIITRILNNQSHRE